MENHRVIEIEEDYVDEEVGEELTPEGMMRPMASNVTNAGEEDTEADDDDFDDDDDEEEDEDVDEDEQDEDGEEEEDEDYEDEDEDEEDYEDEEEVEALIPVEVSPRGSNSNSDGRALQAASVINDDLLNCLTASESREESNGGDRGGEEMNRGEIDGLFCPICFEAWTSGGEHQICCLPCGHVYGRSCIQKWLQRCQSSGKCPQCKRVCTFKDVRILYASRLCVADAELHKTMRSLEAKCAYLEHNLQKRMDCWETKYKEDTDKIQHDLADIKEIQEQQKREIEKMHKQLVGVSDFMAKVKEHYPIPPFPPPPPL